MSQSQQTFIDDQDRSKVKYFGNWIRGGGDKEYSGTVASSTHVGDHFTVSFHGDSIVVYGTIDATSGGVQTNYSIDSGSVFQVTSQAGSGDTFRQQFWKSDALGVADHTLQVTMAKIMPSDPDEGTIWFDYFAVTDPTIRELPNKKPVGAIVGGTIGGMIGLLSIIALILLWLRHRRRRINAKTRDKDSEGGGQLPVLDIRRRSRAAEVQPFPVPHTYPSIATRASEMVSRKPRVDHFNAASQRPAQYLTKSSAVAPPSGSELSSSSVDADESAPDTVRHIDSGLRAVGPVALHIPATVVELPPVYSPV